MNFAVRWKEDTGQQKTPNKQCIYIKQHTLKQDKVMELLISSPGSVSLVNGAAALPSLTENTSHLLANTRGAEP